MIDRLLGCSTKYMHKKIGVSVTHEVKQGEQKISRF